MDLIDIHVHILPGLDDGSRDLKQSLAMAEAALQDGVNLIVATPRVGPGSWDHHKSDILQHVQNLNQCLDYARVKLPVLPGAEYCLAPDLAQHLRAGRLLTLNNNGRYLLVELPPEQVPDYAPSLFYALLKQGVVPIISHPERNRALAQDPAILQEFSARGILAQVTSASITGRLGRSVKKTALQFLQTGAAQLVASDGNEAEGRPPVLYAAFLEIERRLGVACARAVICHNPFQVTQGLPVQAVPPVPRESLWQKIYKNN